MSAQRIQLASAAIAGVVIDRVTKLWAEQALRGRGIVPVIDGYFELRLSHNRGAFFSMGAGMPESVRVAVFVVVTLATLAFIAWLLARTPEQRARQRWALTLFASGGAGNMIDRMQRGEVTDFLHLHLRELFHWATFNVADMLIAAGLVLVFLEVLRPDRAPRT